MKEEVLFKYVLPLVIGFAMGSLKHLNDYLQVKNELPKNDRKMSYLRLFITAAYGGVASLIAVLSIDPSGVDNKVLTAILAGYLGEVFVENTAFQNFNIKDEMDEIVKQKRNNVV